VEDSESSQKSPRSEMVYSSDLGSQLAFEVIVNVTSCGRVTGVARMKFFDLGERSLHQPNEYECRDFVAFQSLVDVGVCQKCLE
jgi:hypothetical protein